MSPCLADGLSAARRRNFVGSTVESVPVQAALEFPELPFLVPHVFGPGGVGKARCCARRDCCRSFIPQSSVGFCQRRPDKEA